MKTNKINTAKKCYLAAFADYLEMEGCVGPVTVTRNNVTHTFEFHHSKSKTLIAIMKELDDATAIKLKKAFGNDLCLIVDASIENQKEYQKAKQHDPLWFYTGVLSFALDHHAYVYGDNAIWEYDIELRDWFPMLTREELYGSDLDEDCDEDCYEEEVAPDDGKRNR